MSLDLLTFADLEALRSRKPGGGPVPARRNPGLKHQENKRHLILVYSVELDRWVTTHHGVTSLKYKSLVIVSYLFYENV